MSATRTREPTPRAAGDPAWRGPPGRRAGSRPAPTEAQHQPPPPLHVPPRAGEDDGAHDERGYIRQDGAVGRVRRPGPAADALTRAKPMPVTRCVTAPAATPSGNGPSSADDGVRQSQADRPVAHVLELLEPAAAPWRPRPDCWTPPISANATEGSALFAPTMSTCGRARRHARGGWRPGTRSCPAAPSPSRLRGERLVLVAEGGHGGGGAEDLTGREGDVVRDVREQRRGGVGAASGSVNSRVNRVAPAPRASSTMAPPPPPGRRR